MSYNFDEITPGDLEDPFPSLQTLLDNNKELNNTFRQNLLFRLMRANYFSSQEKHDTFLDYFQIWSTYFQKMMLLKTALCDNVEFMPLFHQHLDEEYGHDKLLFQERRTKNIKSDAILEALCNWFVSKMLSFTPHEQIVVVNLCIESSANIFHEYAIPALDPSKQLIYLKTHAQDDLSHEQMGVSLLEGLTPQQYKRLLVIQKISWEMLEALMNRLAELVVKSDIPE